MDKRFQGTETYVATEDLTIAVGTDADEKPVEEACKLAVVMALGANGARHLANTAPNEMTPAALAEQPLP